MSAPESVADYIDAAPVTVQPMLRELRETIRAAAPDAEERISYGMPYYHLHGRLVYFRAHTHHIGLYPCSAEEAREVGLEQHVAAKATLQFALGQPLPLAAIRMLIEQRVARITANGAGRPRRKPA